jgi:hypothetical protein
LQDFWGQSTNASILGWDISDPASWDDKTTPGVAWIELDGLNYLKSVNLTGAGVTGGLNLSGCAELNEIAVNDNMLTSIDVSNTPNLTRLFAAGNQIVTFDAEDAVELSVIDLSDNPNAPRSDIRSTLEMGCLVYTDNSAKMSLIWNSAGDELLVKSVGGGYVTGMTVEEGDGYYWLFIYPQPGYEFAGFESHDGISINSELETEHTYYGEKTTNGQSMSVTAVFQLAKNGEFYGIGTEDVPYLIYTAADLAKMSELVRIGDTKYNDEYAPKHYKLMNDIDLSDYGIDYRDGKGWVPIGASKTNSTSPFYGTFDGGGHTISGLYINDPTLDHAGLFGILNGVAAVRNLAVVDVDITAGVSSAV